MENSIQLLMQKLSLDRDQAIYIYNNICNELNFLSHDATIHKADQIINIILGEKNQ